MFIILYIYSASNMVKEKEIFVHAYNESGLCMQMFLLLHFPFFTALHFEVRAFHLNGKNITVHARKKFECRACAKQGSIAVGAALRMHV